MIVLGINAFHADAAAALVMDGEVVAAAEEERFRRIKHWAGFPSEAIRWCLADAGIDADEITHVAINPDPRAARGARIRYALRHWPSPALVLDRLRARRRRLGVDDLLQATFPGEDIRAELVRVAHHRAHLASAFFVSPYERALAVSVDGMGDFASAAWGTGDGTRLEMAAQIAFPHSLGVFYQAMTQYLGFPHYGDEYKVMGLAPYGEPSFVDALRGVVRSDGEGRYALDLRYFVHHRQRIAYDWDDGVPTFATLYSPALIELLGPARAADEPLTQRHKDLARSVQVIYEEALFALLRALHPRHRCDRLVLAGGCAQNSVANGKIAIETPFTETYVAAAGYDAGGAIGAALDVWHARGGARTKPLAHAQLGPTFSGDAIASMLALHRDEIAAQGCTVTLTASSAEVDARVVDCIIAGGVVGWFQGRLEWGPRALGQRSILADPRRDDVKEILNRKIKRRESFRPFAPSVLREHVAAWFEREADVPFMAMVLPIRAEKRAAIPAVTHVDGSGRLQTVTADAQPRYHQLISAFHARTGVPMLLNTSFNENEPIVCRPEEALDCFLRTRMDLLVLGDAIVQRPSVENGARDAS
jgi:carbamoyltransferase